MPEPLLSVQNLSFQYPSYPNLPSEPLFEELNLDIRHRERCLILGRPESGKTTLARLLTGLVPRYSGGACSGKILLDGRAAAERQPCERIEEIGLAFQNPEEQLVRSRCDSEVAFGLEALNLPRSSMLERVGKSLSQAGLSAYSRRSPGTLSGGEKKKLLLACLMALKPAVWVMDETLEELDIGTKKEVLELLRAQEQTCLVFSSKWHRLFADAFTSCCLLTGGRMLCYQGRTGGPAFRSWLRKHEFLTPRRRTSAPQGKRSRPDGDPLLRVRGLIFHYPGADGFYLNVDELCFSAGETIALIGANGSGKSTLAKLLCGLLTAGSGEISIRRNGGWKAANPELLNRFCGYMFQNPDYQIFLPEVREELAYGLKQTMERGGDIEGRVEEAIRLFRLPGPQAPPSLMSYGARKRLQAAVYYLLERPFLILDEGDSGISAADFADIVEKLSAPRRTLLIITHDLELAALLADRIYTLRDGGIVPVESAAGAARLEALVEGAD